MATDISICSAALLQLGKAPIASFSQIGDLARLCSNLYGTERDSILREFSWNCATKREILAPLTDVPKYGFTAAFPLPSDFLRLIAIDDTPVDSDNARNFKIEGRNILASGTSLKVEYVYRAPESEWDAKLVELMTARMLWKLAYPVTQSTTLRDELKSEYADLAKMARNIDSQENPSPQFGDDSPLLEGRY